MTAALNYGFVTYFDASANIKDGVFRLFQKISRPLLKDVTMEFGRADLHDLLPIKFPAVFAGHYFFITGLYRNPSLSGLGVGGKTVAGSAAFDFKLDFASQKTLNKFAEHVWAKEKIDALEREVDVYGQTPNLKEELIRLSLQYNIRCRYTAYIADYKTEYADVRAVDELTSIPRTYLLYNYPNPFNSSTLITFYIAANSSRHKLIKIYNIRGQLAAVWDVSDYPPGLHTLRFDGIDLYGQPLPSGVYFVRLEAGDEVSTIRIILQR
ncbi:MAG: T9SS type A sorting domain-containing protein [candidate division KSB1 bacterium]|nr:T9SS type A sorting domain-containing protein [candidate division KSB1 bacterium]